VALAAAQSGARAEILVPGSAPEAKKARIRAFGATLDDRFASYDDAEDAAVARASERGMTFVHAFSDPAVVAGQGTVALEILEDLRAVRTVIVPVGGGGLAAGMGAVLKPEGVRVIGVQSDHTPNVHAALAAGHLVDCPVVPTLADGLAGRTDEISVQRVRRLLDDVRLVPEAALAPALRDLFRHEGVVAEGAGVVPVAALLALTPPLQGPVVLVISGRNIDAAQLARILQS
jgi:threonine dehydratase